MFSEVCVLQEKYTPMTLLLICKVKNLNLLFSQYLEVDTGEHMNIPGVSVLFAGDNWNWPCSLDLLPPPREHSFHHWEQRDQRGQWWAGRLGNDNVNRRWEGGLHTGAYIEKGVRLKRISIVFYLWYCEILWAADQLKGKQSELLAGHWDTWSDKIVRVRPR